MCACFQQDEKQYFATKSSPFPGSVTLLNLPPPKKNPFPSLSELFLFLFFFFLLASKEKEAAGWGRTEKNLLICKGGRHVEEGREIPPNREK